MKGIHSYQDKPFVDPQDSLHSSLGESSLQSVFTPKIKAKSPIFRKKKSIASDSGPQISYTDGLKLS